MVVRASGWAEREGGARRRVLWVVVGSALVAAVGIAKSEVLSIVKEGAMVAVMLCVLVGRWYVSE